MTTAAAPIEWVHARTFSATTRHYVNPALTAKTLCGSAVFLAELYTENGTEVRVPLETLFMEVSGPRPYCARCLNSRRRLEVGDPAPAPGVVDVPVRDMFTAPTAPARKGAPLL